MSRFADSSELREAARLAGRILNPEKPAAEAAEAAQRRGAAAAPPKPARAPGKSAAGHVEPDLLAVFSGAVEAGVRRFAAARRVARDEG